MKYTSINPIYESPRPEQGKFDNPFVQTSEPKKWLDKNGEVNLTINFDMRYIKNGEEVSIEKAAEVAFKEHQPTLILNENDQEEDIRDFLARGGVYDKERILQWGRPSAEIMENEYLDPTTLWCTNIQLTQNEPQRTIAKDWIDENITIQGLPIGDNFLYDEQS